MDKITHMVADIEAQFMKLHKEGIFHVKEVEANINVLEDLCGLNPLPCLDKFRKALADLSDHGSSKIHFYKKNVDLSDIGISAQVVSDINKWAGKDHFTYEDLLLSIEVKGSIEVTPNGPVITHSISFPNYLQGLEEDEQREVLKKVTSMIYRKFSKRLKIKDEQAMEMFLLQGNKIDLERGERLELALNFKKAEINPVDKELARLIIGMFTLEGNPTRLSSIIDALTDAPKSEKKKGLVKW